MTTQDKHRIAIAEAHGMIWCRIGEEDKPYRMLCWWNPAYDRATMAEPICNPAYMWEHGRVPDYFNDLNAMHEAEKILALQQQSDYHCHILALMPESWHDCTESRLWNYVHATAAQRAEAFLRTLGKWEG